MHVLNILWVVFGIGLMLVLNLKFKINSMVALLVAALSVGMLAGMDLMSLLHTMKAGFGNTLGELAIIVVFGAVIGKLMVDSGAAHQIAHTLLARLGLRYVQISVIIIGLIFGLAMFYEVAFIMLAPLVIVIAAEAKIPFLKLAIPAVAAATTAHSLFPPQPGPALLVLATAAGSNTLTHINDASFWLFKGYFDLSVKDTLKTWGLLELVNSVVGLIIVLIISMVA
ncbi:hypothetical protein KEQ66_10940 [Escherichia coli]|nr:hypothetical protein [Escherichia coli]